MNRCTNCCGGVVRVFVNGEEALGVVYFDSFLHFAVCLPIGLSKPPQIEPIGVYVKHGVITLTTAIGTPIPAEHYTPGGPPAYRINQAGDIELRIAADEQAQRTRKAQELAALVAGGPNRLPPFNNSGPEDNTHTSPPDVSLLPGSGYPPGLNTSPYPGPGPRNVYPPVMGLYPSSVIPAARDEEGNPVVPAAQETESARIRKEGAANDTQAAAQEEATRLFNPW